jgi:HAD superfamily hydrolase (TIGR01490 family)
MKLVVFDFCETLVRFQTADRFVDYIIEKENYRKYQWIDLVRKILFRTRVLAVVSKFFPNLNPSKRLKLLQLRGLDEVKLINFAKEFTNELVRNNLIQPLYDLMKEHLNQNDYVVIVSGGYEPYIKVFAEQEGVNYFFATEMELYKNKLTGHFAGKDCLQEQKVILLEDFFKKNDLQFSNSIAYSDNSSDLPLLKWANTGVVVSKNKSQNWAKENNLSEIVHE